ncbi:MAG: hypothetical protein ACRDSP_02805 [Pseudonocardiaceae bacterium]
MAFGRKRPEQTDGTRTTSYPQGETGKAPVAGVKRTTSYKNSIQVNTRGYETIN